MGTVRRLVFKNFKRFKALELEFDPELNILVGGNEAGTPPIFSDRGFRRSVQLIGEIDGLGSRSPAPSSNARSEL